MMYRVSRIIKTIYDDEYEHVYYEDEDHDHALHDIRGFASL